MWTWDYELRTLGSWPSERYNGHNMPVEVVTKADHDAALRRVKAEGLREAVLAMETYAVRSYAIAHVMASVAELERDARAAQIEEGE